MLGSFFGSALKFGLGSGLGSGISSIPNALLNYGLGKSATRHAQNLSMDAWNEQMRTRYQHTVGDLRKAGLNPILAVTGGLGGSGSTPQASPVYPGSGFSSAADVMRSGAEKERVKSQINVDETIKAVNKASAGKLKNESTLALARMVREMVLKDIDEIKLRVERLRLPKHKVISNFWNDILNAQHFYTRRGEKANNEPWFKNILWNLLDYTIFGNVEDLDTFLSNRSHRRNLQDYKDYYGRPKGPGRLR